MQKLLLAATFFLNSIAAQAVEQLPFEGDAFTVEGKPGFIIEPEKRAPGNPWVWYAPTLQNLPNQGHTSYVKQFLDHGIAVKSRSRHVRSGHASLIECPKDCQPLQAALAFIRYSSPGGATEWNELAQHSEIPSFSSGGK